MLEPCNWVVLLPYIQVSKCSWSQFPTFSLVPKWCMTQPCHVLVGIALWRHGHVPGADGREMAGVCLGLCWCSPSSECVLACELSTCAFRWFKKKNALCCWLCLDQSCGCRGVSSPPLPMDTLELSGKWAQGRWQNVKNLLVSQCWITESQNGSGWKEP